MPGGDRRGPRGAGPLTGRGAGYCAGYPVPGYANPHWAAAGGPGRGWGRGGWGWGRGGRGWGRGGRGWRHGYYATEWPGMPPFPPEASYGPMVDRGRADEVELQALKEQTAHLEQVLEDMKSRMQELEGSTQSSESESR